MGGLTSLGSLHLSVAAKKMWPFGILCSIGKYQLPIMSCWMFSKANAYKSPSSALLSNEGTLTSRANGKCLGHLKGIIGSSSTHTHTHTLTIKRRVLLLYSLSARSAALPQAQSNGEGSKQSRTETPQSVSTSTLSCLCKLMCLKYLKLWQEANT